MNHVAAMLRHEGFHKEDKKDRRQLLSRQWVFIRRVRRLEFMYVAWRKVGLNKLDEFLPHINDTPVSPGSPLYYFNSTYKTSNGLARH